MRETANYHLRQPERGTRPDRVDVEDLNYNADIIDEEMNRLEEEKATKEEFETHRKAAVLDHPNGSVTDAKIGNRTIGATEGTLTVLLGALADEIKAAKGSGDWEEQPQTDLAEAKRHIDSTDNPHGVTKQDVGLANVDDTADEDKPLSKAAIAAFLAVENALVEKVNQSDIVQSTGTSEDKVMSQKAVTDALAALELGSGSGTLVSKEFNIGNGAAKSFTVTHNFNAQYPFVRIIDTTTKKEVYGDITYTNENSLKIDFDVAVAANKYKVIVQYTGESEEQ